MLVYQKSAPNRLEVRIYGPKSFRALSTLTILIVLINVALGVVFNNAIYFILAAVLMVPAVALRRIYRGRVMYVQRGKGKILLHPGVVVKGEPRKLEWPEMELTEARMIQRQVFVGRDKESRIIVGLTRRALKPTPLVEVDNLEEAVEFAIRLCRTLKCDLVDATVAPPGKYPTENVFDLRKKLSAGDMDEGDRVTRPSGIDRRRKSGGYEFRWKRQNRPGTILYTTLGLIFFLLPIYILQSSYSYLPLLMWLPAGLFAYLAFFEWATIYNLTVDAQNLTYIDGRRANDPRQLKWELVRGLRRVGGKGRIPQLEIRTLRPFQIYCSDAAITGYLEEQIGRFVQKYGPAQTVGR